MKKLIAVLTTIFLTGCSVFGLRTADQPSYQVLNDYGNIQIRHYPDLLIAETEIVADYKNASTQGFQRLAGYIFGKNRAKQKIAMTAPVLQEAVSEKISMTAPVMQEKKGNAWVMSFVMPEGSTLEALPVPLDPAVKQRVIPGKKVGVIRYSGLHSENNLRNYAEKLTVWIEKQGSRVLSGPRAASYDPPWTIPFLRRNEVHIDIE